MDRFLGIRRFAPLDLNQLRRPCIFIIPFNNNYSGLSKEVYNLFLDQLAQYGGQMYMEDSVSLFAVIQSNVALGNLFGVKKVHYCQVVYY